MTTDVIESTATVVPETPVQEDPNQIKVNIDYIRKQRIQFATPAYGGMMTESTFLSFIKWANTARQLNIDWSIETMVNESLISRARNTLVAKFLESKESTHLMFVDADIGFEPWQVLALLNHDVDIVGGLYPMKTLPVKWVVNGLEGSTVNENGLLEVTKTGTGFMLIKREVFERMNSHPAVKPYKNDIGLDPKYDAYLKTYFDTAVREGRYMSEDWTACANFIELGGKVHVDTRVLLKHTGSFTFSNETQEHLIQQYMPEVVRRINAQGVKLIDQDGNEVKV